MSNVKNRIGLGSASPVLSVMGILFAFSFGDRVCYGDLILDFAGLKPWSDGSFGVHYTIFYSLIFFVPALIFSWMFKDNLGAKSGKISSIIMISIILLMSCMIVM